jgi:flagellin-specific chaperone FliS
MMPELYRHIATETEPRHRYPALVWRGILKLIHEALVAIERGDIGTRHNALIRAQEFIGWLDAAFRDDLLPAVAPAVHAEHARLHRLLMEANLYNDVERLRQAQDGALAMESMWSRAADVVGTSLEGRWST